MGIDEARVQEARALGADLAEVRARIRAGAEGRMARWQGWITRPDFAASARNLADYLALRHADLRPVQPRLAALGLSSLGRCEAHVGATLDATLAALDRIAGADGPADFPDPAAFQQGRARIEAARDRMFGARADGPETRVMVTLPSEAATDPDLVSALVASGADCLRINCAHDDPAAWAAMIGAARSAAAAAGREVPVAMDLGGPKIRIVSVKGAAQTRLMPGDRFALLAGAGHAGKRPAAVLSHPEVVAALVPGQAVWINDGKLRAEVIETAPGRATLRVTGARAKGERLKPEKGVNLPGSDLTIPALTDEDRAHLPFVLDHAQMVGFSFVQTVEDVRALQAAIEAHGAPMPAIVLKIETPKAVRNLPDLIVAAAGRGPAAVMIARGDLAVEIGFERLSEIQEEILWLCEAAQVAVIWATQVLEGMIKDGQASRAETTDAAMGQRAECVMLNKGPHLAEAVVFLRSILGRMDRHTGKKTPYLGPLGVWP
ncbi:MAG: pyruvate kinase [Pseudomonadota bacterium]